MWPLTKHGQNAIASVFSSIVSDLLCDAQKVWPRVEAPRDPPRHHADVRLVRSQVHAWWVEASWFKFKVQDYKVTLGLSMMSDETSVPGTQPHWHSIKPLITGKFHRLLHRTSRLMLTPGYCLKFVCHFNYCIGKKESKHIFTEIGLSDFVFFIVEAWSRLFI